MKKYFGLLILICQFAISEPRTQAQHGVAAAWGPEVKLPAPPGSSSFRGFLYSNMGILSNGRRVIVLNRQDGKMAPYISYSDDGIHWSTPVLFAPDTMVIGLYNLKMIAGNDDTLHFVWGSHLPEALFYSKMSGSLELILDTVRIADDPDFNSFDDMYISTDRKGRIHIMWDEGKTGKDLPEIYYSKSGDGGRSWKEKIRLSNDDGMPSSFPRGQFNACNGDTIAIAWRDSTPAPPVNHWNLQLVVSFDGGDSWSSPSFIRPMPAGQMDPDIVVDPEGRFHVFYHETPTTNQYWGERIKYGWSDDFGQSWQPQGDFETVSRDQRSRLVEGSRYDYRHGILWTFWKEEDLSGMHGGDIVARYSPDRGATWMEPEYASDHNDTSIGYKSVDLLPDGGIGVNYEVPNYGGEGKFWVFYRERSPVSMSGLSVISANDLRIFPIPCRERLIISSAERDISEVEIFDLNGGLMISQTPGEESQSMEIGTGNLPAGIYLLRVRTPSSFSVQKIIKL